MAEMGISAFYSSAQPAAGSHPSWPWHLLHQHTGRAKASLVGGNKEGKTDGPWLDDISPTLGNLCYPLGVTLPLGLLSSFHSAPFPPLSPLHKALPILPVPRETEQ